ncbi:MAG: phage tail tape measure protein [Thermoprotei archaeon]|nr:MAG: phage tail tape measure protein [Thermoprotei archaeon]
MSYTVSILIEAVDRASGVFRSLSDILGVFSLELGVVQGAAAGLAMTIVTELIDAVERAIEVAMECAEAYAQYEWVLVLVRVATATGALGEQARALAGRFEELTRSVGVEFGVGAAGAAEALESLVKAGLEGEEATRALEATLTLAQIELMDAGEAADYVAATLRAFSLSADQAAHVVDVLVNASIKGIATAREFAYALGYCSGIAAQMGLSLEETVAALVAMNNQGIQATYAGRYLMRMLQDLVEHSDRLGFSIYGASRASRGPSRGSSNT